MHKLRVESRIDNSLIIHGSFLFFPKKTMKKEMPTEQSPLSELHISQKEQNKMKMSINKAFSNVGDGMCLDRLTASDNENS